MLGERLGRWVAHGQDVHDELMKELGAVILLIHGAYGFAGGYNFIEVEEIGHELAAGVTQNAAVEAGFGADEEGRAFGSEGVKGVAVAADLGEKVEADEGVHDGGETTDGCVGGFVDLLDGFWAAVECVEDMMGDGCFKDERGDVAPGELHDALGGDRRLLCGIHDCSWE